eukprot:Phypoly_transcript_11478.p1 GENE.Phypoly_transcript_11478~~Phypoly_transcript_11478.p1  ORF type:complete len:280 (+),score=21.29 Phypoly_transcript_11478:126-965(+)
MKTSLHKPLLRMATAHSAVMGNTKPSQGASYSTLPLLASRTPSSYSSTPESTSTIVSPRITNFHGMQRNFSATTHSYRRSVLPPLGTLAIIGGVMLFLGHSTADAFSIPFFNKATPASRMKERLEKHGFIEAPVVPDGNCQMRALADQIHGDENYHADVRSKIIAWLSKNEKFPIDDSGSTLGDFIDRDHYPRWSSYVIYMSRNGSWGDHITLVAAAEVYGVQISIISNVDDGGAGQYMTTITPRSQKPTKTVNLSHWHELHYNSLHPIKLEPVGGREL